MRQLVSRLMLASFLVGAALPAAWAAGPWQPKDRLEANDNGVWRPVTILEVKDGQYLIHYEGWESAWDAWVGPDRLRETNPIPDPGMIPVGTKVNALDGSTWRPATVLAVQPGQYFIHYDGWSSGWDLWLKPDQVRSLGNYEPFGAFKVGDTVDADDNGTWRPATILQAKDGQYFIHYVGWSNTWDAWVGPERVRPMPPAFKAGDFVEVEVSGTWRRAIVREAQESRYFIHLDGGDPQGDTWFDYGQVRALTP